MSNLKIGPIEDDKPVTMTIKLSAGVHRDLIAYAEALKRESGQKIEPNTLVSPMLARFMGTDRVFRRARRKAYNGEG